MEYYLEAIALLTVLNFTCERFLTEKVFGFPRSYWRALGLSLFQASIFITAWVFTR